MEIPILIFALSILASADNFDHHVRPKCASTDRVCEYNLTLSHQVTMVHRFGGKYGPALPVIIAENGTYFVKQKADCSIGRSLTAHEAGEIVTGDGRYKLSMLFNKQLPGPPIVVYRGQQVVVHVKNDLHGEGLTVHWHGLYMRQTPWMDGASGVSHCPIQPGNTFTYRFIADPVGTHWYHSHHGGQRTMGAYGPLIVLPKDEQESKDNRGSDPLPEFDDDFILMVSDWMFNSSTYITHQVMNEVISFAKGYGSSEDMCFQSTKQVDGLDNGVVPFESALINGKGRFFHNRDTPIPKDKYVPIQKFRVILNKYYRFRGICPSMTFDFRISIDQHSLHVVATDGSDVITKEVESLIISPGERYDFYIQATDEMKLGNYWLRVETLERAHEGKRIKPGHVEAMLHYEGYADREPKSVRRSCTEDNPCKVLNCPYRYYPVDEHTICLDNTKIRATHPKPTFKSTLDRNFEEYFLNLHFSGKGQHWKPTINGIQHVNPTAPPQIRPKDVHQYIKQCNNETCAESGLCKCTHILHVPLGSVVQLNVITTVRNADLGRVNEMNGNVHQFHLHGNKLQVLHYGWPKYDTTTARFISVSEELQCLDAVCDHITWRNPSWLGGNIPISVTEGAVEKDTVQIPAGGYVVLRFLADNPGYWYLHCHTEFHYQEGMALIIKVGEDSEMVPPPDNMPTCGNFHWSSDDFENVVQSKAFQMSQTVDVADSTNATYPGSAPDSDASADIANATDIEGTTDLDESTTNNYLVIIACTLCLNLFLLFLCIVLYCKMRSDGQYSYKPIPGNTQPF